MIKTANDPANRWKTPNQILHALGSFDLDPCAASDDPSRCAIVGYTFDLDGLRMPWWGRVFCNPPYGRFARPWLEKCALHGNAVALVTPKSIGAAWFQRLLAGTTIRFLQGRQPFIDPETNQPAAANTQWSMLIAWGKENKILLHCVDLPGFTVDVPPPDPEP